MIRSTTSPYLVAALLSALAGGTAGCQPPPDSGASQPRASEWLGTQFPPAPDGVTISIGTTIGTADTATFALADVHASGRHYLWLGRRLPGDSAARYEVLDVLDVTSPEGNQAVVFATCGTRRPGVTAPQTAADVVVDPEVVAAAPFVGTDEVHTRVGRAWRADRARGQFVSVPAEEIVCFHEGDPNGA